MASFTGSTLPMSSRRSDRLLPPGTLEHVGPFKQSGSGYKDLLSSVGSPSNPAFDVDARGNGCFVNSTDDCDLGSGAHCRHFGTENHSRSLHITAPNSDSTFVDGPMFSSFRLIALLAGLGSQEGGVGGIQSSITQGARELNRTSTLHWTMH